MGQPIPPRRRIRRRFSPIMVAILGLAVIIVWFVLVKASGLMLPLRLRTTVARWDVVEQQWTGSAFAVRKETDSKACGWYITPLREFGKDG